MASEQLDKRLDYWKQQLLESGWHNMMINYTQTKMTGIKLVEPLLGELFSRIVINEEVLTFQISTDENENIREYSESSGKTLFPTLQLGTGDIKTDGDDEERRKTLRNLRVKSKLTLEERGFNILHVVCGFIEWRHPNDPQSQWIKSPLVLVPVCLNAEGINSLYNLKRYEDEIVVNPYLAYLFETEYGISLPSFDGYNKTIDDFISEMRDLAYGCGWKISLETSLALLSPAKITAYKDLVNNRNRIINNSVIHALSGDTNKSGKINDGVDLLEDHSILSKEFVPVVKADFDQKAAILYSKKGMSFVLQGPPGTGKSQTITNIIAEALADGKKVLFAAEKSKALEAVYKRLTQSGLSDYCLPLYACNLNKKEILSELGSTLKLQRIKLYDGVTVSDPNNTKSDGLSAANSRWGGNVSNNPWVGIKPLSVDPDMQQQIKQNFSKAASILKSILGVYNEINAEYGLKLDLCLNNLPDITELLYCACAIFDVPPKWFTDFENGHLLNYAKDIMEICHKYNTLNNEVLELFDKNILDYDIQKWTVEFSKNLEALKNKPILQLKNASSYIDSLEDFKNGFISLRHTVCAIENYINEFNNICGLEYRKSIGSIDLIDAFLSLIVTMPKSIEGWFDNDFAKASLELLKKAKVVTNDIKDKIDVLLLNWEKDILEFDFQDILDRYKNEYAGFLKHFNNEYRKDRKSILEFSKTPLKNFDDESTLQLLMELKSIADNKKWFEENHMELINCFGEYYCEIDTPWDKIENWINGILNISLHFNDEVPQKLKDFMTSGELHENIESINRIVTSLKNEKTMAELLIARYTSIKEYIILEIDEILAYSDEILVTLECLEDNYAEFCSLLGDKSLDSTAVINSANIICEWQRAKEDFENNDSLCRERFGNYYDSLNTDWNKLLSAINSVYVFKKNNPSEEFVRAICVKNDIKEKVKVSANIIEELHKELKYCYDWICSLFENSEYLNELSIDKLIKKLMACINDLPYLENLTAYLDIKEECNKTEHNNVISSLIKVEKSILHEEIAKKRDIMPLRRLFGAIPNLLMLLKPCLMMSPLSVSSFLEAKEYSFDLVIFDEASQILPEDAIAAISRGSQVVIAGDNRQLPPTNLLSDNSKNYDAQYDFNAEDDFDEFMKNSILYEALNALPEKTLLTHYRSRYEQLIAFSNREIYKNKLIIPACKTENSEEMGIRYIYVEAGYNESGSDNCNIPEAKRCAMLVQEHIAQYPERSLGIIAFSNGQRMIIESAIDEFRVNNPQYEVFFDENNEEPFFVKSIENVQGDERDTIIISLCYAKDQDGKMNTNFGPLGQKGGERFLNVAITRAKCNTNIVGSILPEEIDLSITDSAGIRLLRAYLEFVLKEQEALMPIVTNKESEGNQDCVSDVSSQILEDKAEKTNHVDQDNVYGFEFYSQWKKSTTNCVNSNDELTKITENIFEVISLEQPIHIDLLYKRLGSTFPAGRVTESVKRIIDDVIDKEFIEKVRIDADSFIRLLPESEIKVRIPRKGDTPRPMEFICKEEVVLAIEGIAKKSNDISAEDLVNECAKVFGFERRGIKIKAKTDAALEYLIQNGKIEIVDGKVQLLGEISAD